MELQPITDEQRAANKANRLRHAASVNDGLTVRFLQGVSGEPAGSVRVVTKSRALDLVRRGLAEHAE